MVFALFLNLFFNSLLDFKAHTLIQSTKRGAKPGETVETVEQAVRVCANVKARQEREKKAAQRVPSETTRPYYP